jgi:hypothetical protein
MKPFPSSVKKITALGLILMGLTLPACNASWIAEPLSRYVQRKTGLDIQIKEVDWNLWSLAVNLKSITLGVEQKTAKGRVVIPDLSLRFGWEFSAGPPFAPRFWVERMTIDSPQISLRWLKSEEKSDWRSWLKTIPAIRQLEIRNLSGRVEREGAMIQFPPGTSFSGAFRPDQGGRVNFRCQHLEGSSVTPRRSFTGEVRGSMEIDSVSESLPWKGSLSFSGAYRHNGRIQVDGLAGTLQVKGTNTALEVKEGTIHFSQVAAQFGPYWLTGEGRTAVEGSWRLIFSDHQTGVFPRLTVRGEDIKVTLRKDAQRITGQTRVHFQMEGSLDRPSLQGFLETTRTVLELSPVKIAGLAGRLEFKGDLSRVVFPRITARAETLLWEKDGRPLLLNNPETKFRALLVTGEKRLVLEEIFLQADPWGALQGALVFDPALGASPGGSVRFRQFPLLGLINLLTSGPVQKEMESWPVTGTLSWGREKKNAPLDFRVALEASGLEGAEADGRYWTVKSLDTRVTARLAWDPIGREISGIWKQELLKGFLAYNDWGFSFYESPLPLEFNGKMSYPPGGFRVRGTLRFQHPSLGSWTGSGDLDWGSRTIDYQGRVRGTSLPLQETTSLLAEQAGGSRFPWLRRTKPRGVISAEFSLDGSNQDYRIQGRVRGSDLDFDARDPEIHFHISQLDLPVRWGSVLSREPMDPEPQAGRIQLRDLRTPWSSISFMEIPVSAGFKTYRIPAPLAFPLWGGELTTSGIAFDGSGDRLSLQAEANLSEVDLSAILPGRGIEGKLGGPLGTIKLNVEQASASGELTARVFDGTVKATDLRVVRPFDTGRRIQGKVLFDHLNLEPLTRLFSFGKISGYVQGTIEHLSWGPEYPERFYLTLKTEEVAGVPKRINVQAIENVSLLGTGWGELGGLRSGINRWFQEYNYREIGLSCSLAEGRVTLRGTIFEDGLEFLVRKPGLMGIDVINRNPENEIDFSDMLERIRRIKNNKAQGGKNDAP